MEELIRVLLVEPGQPARPIFIEKTLAMISYLVGEPYETVPWGKNALVFQKALAEIGNDEYPMNRVIIGRDRKPVNIISGTFLICGPNGGSLPEKETKEYLQKFRIPDKFEKMPDGTLNIYHNEIASGLSDDTFYN